MALTVRGTFGLPWRETIPTVEKTSKHEQQLVKNNFQGRTPCAEKTHKETYHKERV
jgi:hypothetical protein